MKKLTYTWKRNKSIWKLGFYFMLNWYIYLGILGNKYLYIFVLISFLQCNTLYFIWLYKLTYRLPTLDGFLDIKEIVHSENMIWKWTNVISFQLIMLNMFKYFWANGYYFLTHYFFKIINIIRCIHINFRIQRTT